MRPSTLLTAFIRPTLKHLAIKEPSIDSPAARQIMLAIAGQESACGRYFAQLGDGPARGIWQVEPATHRDLQNNYLKYRLAFWQHLNKLLPDVVLTDPLLSCQLYSCGVARLCLYRQPDPMPALGDKNGMWQLYKKYFNSHLGAATKAEWDHNWEKYVEGVELG